MDDSHYLRTLKGFDHTTFRLKIHDYLERRGLLPTTDTDPLYNFSTMEQRVMRWTSSIRWEKENHNAVCGLLLMLLPSLRNLTIYLHRPSDSIGHEPNTTPISTEYDAFHELFKINGYQSCPSVQHFASLVHLNNLETFATNGEDIDLLHNFAVPAIRTVEVDYEGLFHAFKWSQGYTINRRHPFGNLDTLKINIQPNTIIFPIAPDYGPEYNHVVSIRKAIITYIAVGNHPARPLDTMFELDRKIRRLQHCLEELEVVLDVTKPRYDNRQSEPWGTYSTFSRCIKLRQLSVSQILLTGNLYSRIQGTIDWARSLPPSLEELNITHADAMMAVWIRGFKNNPTPLPNLKVINLICHPLLDDFGAAALAYYSLLEEYLSDDSDADWSAEPLADSGAAEAGGENISVPYAESMWPSRTLCQQIGRHGTAIRAAGISVHLFAPTGEELFPFEDGEVSAENTQSLAEITYTARR